MLFKILFSPETGDGGGGAPAPTSEPGSQFSEPAHSESNWSGLLGVDSDVPDPEPAMPTPHGDVSQSPGLPAPAMPPVPFSEQAAPQLPPVQPQPPQAVAPQPPVPQQPATPEAQPPQDMLSPEWQAQALQHLTQAYNLGEELTAAYEENPTTALPQLAARLHMNVMMQAMTAMHHVVQNHIPQLIAQHLQQHSKTTKTEAIMESRVFSRFPKLREVSHETMKVISGLLRQRFPNADFDTGMKEAARMAYGMHGWPFPEQGAPPAPQPPEARAAPPAAPPYVPVMPGGMTPPAAANGAGSGGNPFADLIDSR